MNNLADSSDAETPQIYTDSNGREFLQRTYNFRETWDLLNAEPVAGNYYPMNAAAYIKDEAAQLSILTDRSQGVASLAQGQMEVMIQRRLLADDSRGVGEPLNETDVGITSYTDSDCAACREGDDVVVRGSHILQLPARVRYEAPPLRRRHGVPADARLTRHAATRRRSNWRP